MYILIAHPNEADFSLRIQIDVIFFIDIHLLPPKSYLLNSLKYGMSSVSGYRFFGTVCTSFLWESKYYILKRSHFSWLILWSFIHITYNLSHSWMNSISITNFVFWCDKEVQLLPIPEIFDSFSPVSKDKEF